MKDQLKQLITAVNIAQGRGSYTLEESAIIYQVLKNLDKCPALQDKKPGNSDLKIIDEDKEMNMSQYSA